MEFSSLTNAIKGTYDSISKKIGEKKVRAVFIIQGTSIKLIKANPELKLDVKTAFANMAMAHSSTRQAMTTFKRTGKTPFRLGYILIMQDLSILSFNLGERNYICTSINSHDLEDLGKTSRAVLDEWIPCTSSIKFELEELAKVRETIEID